MSVDDGHELVKVLDVPTGWGVTCSCGWWALRRTLPLALIEHEAHLQHERRMGGAIATGGGVARWVREGGPGSARGGPGS